MTWGAFFLIVLIVFLIAALPVYPYNTPLGHFPALIILILIAVLIMLLAGLI